jgi:hypothetical protein
MREKEGRENEREGGGKTEGSGGTYTSPLDTETDGVYTHMPEGAPEWVE